ncbi:hypothetical protein V8C34DRAFT_9197 [Trichoderma compactum]
MSVAKSFSTQLQLFFSFMSLFSFHFIQQIPFWDEYDNAQTPEQSIAKLGSYNYRPLTLTRLVAAWPGVVAQRRHLQPNRRLG